MAKYLLISKLFSTACQGGFECQAHHLHFFQFIQFNLYICQLNSNVKRMKINKKRPGLVHFKNTWKSSVSILGKYTILPCFGRKNNLDNIWPKCNANKVLILCLPMTHIFLRVSTSFFQDISCSFGPWNVAPENTAVQLVYIQQLCNI